MPVTFDLRCVRNKPDNNLLAIFCFSFSPKMPAFYSCQCFTVSTGAPNACKSPAGENWALLAGQDFEFRRV